MSLCCAPCTQKGLRGGRIVYRCTYLIRNCPPTWDHNRRLDMVLLLCSTGRRFLISEVPLQSGIAPLIKEEAPPAPRKVQELLETQDAYRP